MSKIRLSQESPYIILVDVKQEYQDYYRILHTVHNNDAIEVNHDAYYQALEDNFDTFQMARDSFYNRRTAVKTWKNQERYAKFIELKRQYNAIHFPNPF